MYNWSVDEKKLKKHKEQYIIWKLEQLINYGLNGEKISEKLLKKYWNKLNTDPLRKNQVKILEEISKDNFIKNNFLIIHKSK